MNDIKRQEQKQSIQKLRSLLSRALEPVAEKSDAEWKKHEEAIFARLAMPGSGKGMILERSAIFQSYSRPLIAVAALLVLALNIFIAFQSDFFTPTQSLDESSILNIAGQAAIKDRSGSVPLAQIDRAALKLSAGQQFETGSDGSMMMQVVEGTGFRLSQNSRLEIVKATRRSIHLMLHYGDILFSVRTLDTNSEFVIHTPNA